METFVVLYGAARIALVVVKAKDEEHARKKFFNAYTPGDFTMWNVDLNAEWDDAQKADLSFEETAY